MVWNKVKLQMEGFLNSKLIGRIEYTASGYRYTADKTSNCYMTVDKKDVFKMTIDTIGVNWYQTEQEIKKDSKLFLNITEADINNIRKESGGKIPEERLESIARSRKVALYAKSTLVSQNNLLKSDFQKTSVIYLAQSIDKSLESDDILLNIFALIDRRVGKKRLLAMKETIELKHPLVKYFYEFVLGTKE